MTPISATIITLNETENIARAIRSLAVADEVLVVDSGSTDGTQEIARSLGARVVTHPWPGFSAQKNFASGEEYFVCGRRFRRGAMHRQAGKSGSKGGNVTAAQVVSGVGLG